MNVDDELQIHPKETRLSPETGINHDHIITKPTTPVRRSRRLPFAKQTDKLGGIPYQTNNNRKKININNKYNEEFFILCGFYRGRVRIFQISF